MISRFSLYDFIAALIPGILFLWIISIFTDPIDIPLTGGLAETSVLVALGYVTGLILQGISQGLTEKILLKA
jgi:membrane protein DedA with SNARE-associated domain